MLDAGRFVRALQEEVRDERVWSLSLTGAVEQFIDSTDATGIRALRRAVDAETCLSGSDRRAAGA